MADFRPTIPNIEIPAPIESDRYERSKATASRFLDSLYTDQQIRDLVTRMYRLALGDHKYADAAASLANLLPKPVITREMVQMFFEHNPFFTKALSSRAMAYYMWHEGDPKGKVNQFAKEWNDKLFTHQPDGKLHHIDSTAITKHFQGPESEWPQIVLTANHTLTRGSKDVSSIMDNITGLLKGLFNGRVILEREPDKATDVKGKTIVVAAVHTEQTPLQNGASLLFRNLFLREHDDLYRRCVPNLLDGERPSPVVAMLQSLGIHAKWETEIDHRGPSPAARRLAKLMLKTMLEHPEQLDNVGGDSKDLFLDEARICADRNKDGHRPYQHLVLRADAAKIAQHFTLIGFSKGANVVDDAKRFLECELSATDDKGKPVFSFRNERNETLPLTKRMVKNFVQPISLIGAGGPGVPLTEEEIKLGASGRIRINSKDDMIVGHFDYGRPKITPGNVHDKLFMVEGSYSNMGHDADAYMGQGDDKKGFLHLNQDVVAALKKELGRKFNPQPGLPGHH